jgi:nucleoside 2-deoxyribosyltransferase
MKNILYKTKTYLAGAMQYKNGEDWRNRIQPELEKINITVFNPYHKPFVKDISEDDKARKHIEELIQEKKYDEVQERMRVVRSYDLNLVDRSDFIVAHIDPKVPTYGTVEELVTAVKIKRPTFISIDGGKCKCPYWLFGMFPHKYIYDSIDEVLDMILKIDSGDKEIDSDRWRLLRKELR